MTAQATTQELMSELYSDSVKEMKGPIFENYRDVLSKYYRSVSGKVKGYLGRLGLRQDIDDVNVRAENLPTWYAVLFDRGKVHLRPVGKIFGLYDPSTNTLVVDKTTVPELGDSVTSDERAMLKAYDIGIPSVERVMGEEHIHHAQKKTGAMANYISRMGNKARDYLEGAASSVGDKLFGRTGIYQQEKEQYRQLVERLGERRAFCGAC